MHREIMASDKKVFEYLMFFAKLGLVPAEGWDTERVIVDEETNARRVIFERKTRGSRPMGSLPEFWRFEMDLYKKDGVWFVSSVAVGHRDGPNRCEDGNSSYRAFRFDGNDMNVVDRLVRAQGMVLGR